MMPAMDRPDTSLGGSQRDFPSTALSWVLQAPGPDAARRHFERLVRSYWKPIYAFVRRAWSRSDADAKDLTQSFLVHLMEQDLLTRFQAGRGNFRSYLKQCLRNFLTEDARNAGRLKRGGGRAIVSIEELDGFQPPASSAPPEEEFDRDWTQEVVGAAIEDLEREFRGSGKSAWFESFRLYALEDSGASYAEVAGKVGRSESDVRNYLRAARQELRRLVVRRIAEYVSDPGDVDAEARRILGEP